jgi:hypothetical protein
LEKNPVTSLSVTFFLWIKIVIKVPDPRGDWPRFGSQCVATSDNFAISTEGCRKPSVKFSARHPAQDDSDIDDLSTGFFGMSDSQEQPSPSTLVAVGHSQKYPRNGASIPPVRLRGSRYPRFFLPRHDSHREAYLE